MTVHRALAALGREIFLENALLSKKILPGS